MGKSFFRSLNRLHKTALSIILAIVLALPTSIALLDRGLIDIDGIASAIGTSFSGSASHQATDFQEGDSFENPDIAGTGDGLVGPFSSVAKSGQMADDTSTEGYRADCPVCNGSNAEALKFEKEREAAADKNAKEALELSQANGPSQEEVDAELSSIAGLDAYSGIVPAEGTSIADSTIERDKMVLSQVSQEQYAVNQTSVTHPDYSIDVTLKDIIAFNNVWSGNGSSSDIDDYIYVGRLTDGVENPQLRSSNMGLVKSYAFPSLNSPYLGYSTPEKLNDNVSMKMRLPQSEGEDEETFDLVFGYYAAGGNVRQNKNQWPTINDNTVLANFEKTPGYVASKRTAYLNAYKLAPFASYADLVKSGNAIPATHPLSTKTLRESWPIHQTDGMKTSLFEGDEQNIVRYMLYFTDGTHLVSGLEYLGTRNLAASYVDSQTGMLYQPDFWLIGGMAQKGVDWLAQFIRSKTWNSYFNPFISGLNPKPDFNRFIKDHFDEDMHENAEEVAADLITYMDDWNANAADHLGWRGILNGSISKSPANNAFSSSADPIMMNLLFFYNYYQRLFNIDIGGDEESGYRKDANIFKIMAFKGSVIRSGLSLSAMTAHMNYSKLYGVAQTNKISTVLFPTCLGALTGISSPSQLIEVMVTRTTDYTDYNNWFADYMDMISFFAEYEPKLEGANPELSQMKWRGWDQTKHFQNDILLWVTMEPGAMYFMSTPISIRMGSTHIYSNNVVYNDEWKSNFKSKMDKIGLPETRYAATLTAICDIKRLNEVCCLGVDQISSKLDGGTSWLDSEKLWGKTLSVDPFHRGYTDPRERYNRNSAGSAIMTANSSVDTKQFYYFMGQLSCDWAYYNSHEMSHALDNDVFLRGNRRAGTEDYTDGLLTQQYGSTNYIMNLSADLAKNADVATNLTRERISTKAKLNDYYYKMYETLDTIDYAILQAFLRLSKEEQNQVSMQLQYGGANGTTTPDVGGETVTFIPRNTVIQNYDGSPETMPVNANNFIDGTKKMTTPEEVYDNQIALFPGATGSFTWIKALYISTSLAGIFWHPVHANNNYCDSRSFKLMMYRMLGRHGYDAWANFGRAGGNDISKLKDITGCASFKEWQLKRWDDIESKKYKMDYVDFDELVEKFVSAIRQDASSKDKSLTKMVNLRWRTYYLMKRMTNDFRYGLFDNKAPVTHIRTLEDLLNISKNPYGNYVLDRDIDVSGYVPTGNALISGTFYGKLNGQGRRILSTTDVLPKLFESTKHAYVKDICFDGVGTANFAVSSNNSEYEAVFYRFFERKIMTPEDFLKISSDAGKGVKAFHILSDLDFTSWSAANAKNATPASAVIPTILKGAQNDPVVINGNDHTVKGLTGASLFDKLAFVKLSGLNFDNCANMQPPASGDCVSVLATRTHRCEFSDLFFSNVSISGRYRVGFVCGDDGFIGPDGKDKREAGSRFNRIQVVNGQIVNGDTSVKGNCCYAGFITGRVFNSDLDNIAVRGTFTTYGVSCGGVIGAITGSARLNHCISCVDFNAQHNGNNGVILGDIETNGFDASKTSVSNSVALGATSPTDNNSTIKVGRFARMAANAGSVFHKCYESADRRYGDAYGLNDAVDISFFRTVMRPNFRVNIDYVDKLLADYYTLPYLLDNKQFYMDLGFDDSQWDFEKTISKGYPLLRTPSDEPLRNEYDLDAYVDYQEEAIKFVGSDHANTMTRIDNIYLKILNYSNKSMIGKWWLVDTPMAVDFFTLDSNSIYIGDSIDYSEYISESKFPELTVNGYWTLAVSQLGTSSGKSYDYEKLLKLPKRPEITFESSIKGIRANSNGIGHIQIEHPNAAEIAPTLEYRPVLASPNGASSSASDWKPITSTLTSVPSGDYEIRIAATDHSFASHSITVAVSAFDPSKAIFPVVYEMNGGSWKDGYEAPHEYLNEQATQLPANTNIYRNGYAFAGWYSNASLSGAPVSSIPAGASDTKVFYAKWTANKYRVSLNMNGGTLAKPGTGVAQYTSGVSTTLPSLSRTGYVFQGWYDNQSFEGDAVTQISASDFGDKAFWAKWEDGVYSVSLHLNGGTVPEGTKTDFTYAFSKGASLPDSETITREGHTFEGWYADETFTGAPEASIQASTLGDRQYWAKWLPSRYSVTLVKNGGTFRQGSYDDLSYSYGSSVDLPVEGFNRDGFDFAGWYDNAACNGTQVESIPSTALGDKVFYAKWTPIAFNISYNLGADANGNMPPSNMNLSSFEEYKSGSVFNLPAASAMNWPGHIFAGWYDNPEFDGDPITCLAEDAHGDQTFYAKWLEGETCVISFYTNGGEIREPVKGIYQLGSDGVNKGDKVDLPAASVMTRKGYTFAGWYGNAALTGSAINTTSLNPGTVTVYAKWSVVRYQVKFDLGNGAWKSGYSPTITTYNINSGDLLLPTADKLELANHTFCGWHLNRNFTDTAKSVLSGGEIGDKVYYASWRDDSATDVALARYEQVVTYKASNGGRIQGYTMQRLKRGATTSPVTAVADPGFVFSKWSDGKKDAKRSDVVGTSNVVYVAEFASKDPAAASQDGWALLPSMAVYAANASTGKLTLAQGKSMKLKGAAVAIGEIQGRAPSGKVVYETSNAAIASVNAAGTVKAGKKKTGTAKITIRSADNPNNTKVITVKVVKKAKYKAAKKILKTNLKTSYKANPSKQIKVSVKKWIPSAPSNKNFVITVSPKSKATVDPVTNQITFKGKGTVKVTAKSTADPKAKVVVKVKVK